MFAISIMFCQLLVHWCHFSMVGGGNSAKLSELEMFEFRNKSVSLLFVLIIFS